MAEKMKGLPSPEEVKAKDVLTPEDVAVSLAVGRTTAYKLISSGQLRSFRIGRLRRVLRRDMEHYLKAQVGEADANEVRW